MACKVLFTLLPYVSQVQTGLVSTIDMEGKAYANYLGIDIRSIGTKLRAHVHPDLKELSILIPLLTHIYTFYHG